MDKLFKIALIIRTLENFPLAFIDRLGFIDKEVIYEIRNKKLKFIARAGTEDMPEIVVVASGYEYNIDLINLPPKPIIVDLGGHIGTFSIYLSNYLKNKIKIYVFEPDKQNYKILNKNIKLNKANFIYPQNIAISDYNGKGFLKNEEMNTDAYFLQTNNKGNFNCKVSTLENALKNLKNKKIDLLKIDIEGGEYRIFAHKNTLNYIKSNVHYIFMEYHDINSTYNYSKIINIIENNFHIINKRKNILTLENLSFKKT